MPADHAHGDHDHSHHHDHGPDAPGHDGHDHGSDDHGGHHHHGIGHSHAPASFDRAFAIGVALNTAFVVAEFGFGFAANSVALMADAAHNLGDVLGLLLSWGAAWLGRRPPSPDRTYGWGRSSILAALTNAVILLISVGAIILEAVQRLIHPAAVSETTVIAVALAGIVINGATALLFMRGRENDLNIRGAFLHMAADAAVSAGVVVAAVLIGLTGWTWLDPLTSLAIAAIITLTTWSLLRDSMHLAMDGVPGTIAPGMVHSFLLGLPGVSEVHDLHIWGLSTTDTAMTAHLVCVDPVSGTQLLELASVGLREKFNIGHSTVQIETLTQADLCRLRPDTVV